MDVDDFTLGSVESTAEAKPGARRRDDQFDCRRLESSRSFCVHPLFGASLPRSLSLYVIRFKNSAEPTPRNDLGEVTGQVSMARLREEELKG